MKKVILSALVVVSAILGGCNKGGSSANSMVKAITSGKGMTTEFIYSPDKKVTAIKVYAGTPDTTKVAFTYTGNTVTQSVTNAQSPEPRIQTMHLTAAGYVDSTTMAGPMGSILTLNKQDADGYNTQILEYYGGALKRSSLSVFKDGNEVTRTISDETMKPLATVYFEYYTDKTSSLNNEAQGMKFRGKDSKNLMKKAVQVSAKGDSVAVTFSYKFDDKGRIISQATYERGVQADSNNIVYY